MTSCYEEEVKGISMRGSVVGVETGADSDNNMLENTAYGAVPIPTSSIKRKPTRDAMFPMEDRNIIEVLQSREKIT